MDKSIKAIVSLSREVGITQNLKDLKTDPQDFESLGALACKDACMQDNPVMPSIKEVSKVYMEAYEGLL